MSKLVCHGQKYKRGNISGLERHNERKNKNYSNVEIDLEKSHLNFSLAEIKSYTQAISERISQRNNPQNRALRKDAVLLSEFIISSDKDFFDKLSYEETKLYFTCASEFLSDFFGKENMIYAVVHMDEHTPHMHFGFVPMTDDMRLCAKEIISKNSLKKLQDKLPKHLQNNGFRIQRGDENSQAIHLEPREYKAEMERQKVQLSKDLEHIENKIECTDKILKSCEKIVVDAETLIDKLDCKYQEKQQAVQIIEEELSEKSSTLTETASNLAEQQALLNTTAKKASKIKNIDDISTKKTLFGGNITVSQADFNELSGLAKKQISSVKKEKQLSAENEQLKNDKNLLSGENEALKKEISTLKSIRNQLTIASMQTEIDNWKKKHQKVMDFIDSLGLKEKLQAFLHPQQKKHNMHR